MSEQDKSAEHWHKLYLQACQNSKDDIARLGQVILSLETENNDLLDALRRASLALAFAAESSPAMQDDYNAVSAAIAKATGTAT